MVSYPDCIHHSIGEMLFFHVDYTFVNGLTRPKSSKSSTPPSVSESASRFKAELIREVENEAVRVSVQHMLESTYNKDQHYIQM